MVERLTKQVEKEKRDMQVLQTVVDAGPIGIVRIAETTDIPEHKVRYSLRMLENDGLVEPTPNGAIPAEDLHEQAQSINEGIDHLIDRLDELKTVF